MSDLKLIKSEYFGNVECDFYGKSGEVYMTISQLAECLGYADKSGVQKIVDRNPYLKNAEFSGTDNLVCTPSSRQRNNLHFTHENPSCIPYGAGCYAASRRSWTSIGVRTPRPRWRRWKL